MRGPSGSQRRGSAYAYVLFVIPFIALLWPFYLRDEPRVAGFPFFYWYQFGWLFITAILTWIVYLLRPGERE
jgi:hypothetical protein